jgi:hypothetical protein
MEKAVYRNVHGQRLIEEGLSGLPECGSAIGVLQQGHGMLRKAVGIVDVREEERLAVGLDEKVVRQRAAGGHRREAVL